MYRSRYSAVWSLRCASFNQSLERNRRAGLPLSVMAFSTQRHTVPFLPNERRSAYGLPSGSRSVLRSTVCLTPPAARSFSVTPLLPPYSLDLYHDLFTFCEVFRLYEHRVVRRRVSPSTVKGFSSNPVHGGPSAVHCGSPTLSK